jgi:uncharacterized protein YdeI (YjbR/CyaY-like superfamily)
MLKTKISGGVAHKMPADLKKALQAKRNVLDAWEDITPLARNEFICWVENAKAIDTRARRVRRTCEELAEGKRRPCCWVGCVHRADKPMSASQKWVLKKK